MENFMRESFNIINEMPQTYDSDYYNRDYLNLFNHTTTDEENEIREIIKNIIKSLERIQEIQDDCYGR